MALVVELDGGLLDGFDVCSGGDLLEDQAVRGSTDQDLAY